jgi:hypothetical protein
MPKCDFHNYKNMTQKTFYQRTFFFEKNEKNEFFFEVFYF